MRDFVHKSISTIAFTRISAKPLGRGNNCAKREYPEVVITTEKSETEINSAKRGKNSLASEEDIEFKKFLS